jgi:hypothetical protein
VESANIKINSHCPSFDELISGMTDNGKYAHLRIILSRTKIQNYYQRYLLVTTDGFGVVELLEGNLAGYKINLDLQDINTEMVKKVAIDVDDDRFKFLLISWDDIITMTQQTKENIGSGSTLLEFEF